MNIRFIGIPSNVGSLNPGTELGPQYLRNSGIVDRLGLRHQITDFGDIFIDNDKYRHNYGAVRNWPAPKVMWNKIINADFDLFKKDDFTLIIGGGCSIFTGVFMSFFKLFGDTAHILSFDNHIDMKVPNAGQCIGATAYTLWFLTHDNQWVEKPKGFTKSKITSMGFNKDHIDDTFSVDGIHMYDRDYIHSNDVMHIAQKYLNHLSDDANVVIHIDLDVIIEKDISNVYMPSPKGLPLDKLSRLLKEICKDKRIRGAILTEFSPTNENSIDDASKITEMICNSLENEC